MKTQKIVEDNENNRAQKYPLYGGTGFNQVLIQVQLMYTLQVCDYDEEKEKKEKQQKKDTLPVFYRVLPSARASRVTTVKKAGNDVINILTSEDMEIRHSGPGCSFV